MTHLLQDIIYGFRWLRMHKAFTLLSVATLAEHELPPSQFIINGQQSITINVIK